VEPMPLWGDEGSLEAAAPAAAAEEQPGAGPPRHRLVLLLAGVATLLALSAGAAVVVRSRAVAGRALPPGKPRAPVTVANGMPLLGLAAEAITSKARDTQPHVLGEGEGLPADGEGLPADGEGLPEEEGVENATNGTTTTTTTTSSSEPVSPCTDDAEHLGDFCYRKCSNLTNGRYPFRLNSITCCRNSTDCGLEGVVDLRFGELVSPREASGCNPDEEYLGGLCYKACNILTNGAYPYRVDARKCCSKLGTWSCRLPHNFKQSDHFDVGGGGGCADDAELLGHYCYKKCRILTKGEFPRRSGPSTCCKEKYCHWHGNYQTSHRFNVGSDKDCPDGEELHGNMCYTRCSVLTNGTFPTRVAVATCCSEQDTKKCGLYGTLRTNSRFGESSGARSHAVHVPAAQPLPRSRDVGPAPAVASS